MDGMFEEIVVEVSIEAGVEFLVSLLESNLQNKLNLDWRLTELDVASLDKTTEILARQFGKSDIGRMKIDIEIGDWPAGNHHMGTTRMSESPKDGVVDPNCKLHGFDNLFIAGSSVFPTAGALNPTLTIVALSLRLADHLKGRMA